MKTVFIGIDPGKKGGIACIDTESSIRYTVPYSDKVLIDMCSYESRNGNTNHIVCCLEKVSAMPGQGVVSMFSFGQSVGYIKGVLEAFRIPYQEIIPRKWKGEFGLNANKETSFEVCGKLFPDISLLASNRCTKPHDGMAEALLMAEYARRKL